MSEIEFLKPDEEIEPVLPVIPIAWRVLIRPYEAPETTAGGIIKADETKESEDLLTYVGQIVAMGSECYKLTTRSGIDMSKI
jgi:co-chaperonin GroES (HSP10)